LHLCARLWTAAVVVSLIGADSLPLQAAGPFDSLNGRWSGTGTIHQQGGSAESIRCNANYSSQNGNNLNVQLRCASDSYNFDLSGSVSTDGRSLHGQWTENSRGIGGGISGVVHGDRMQMHIDGAGFSASLGISTRGRQQSVSMESQGGVRANISMSRR